MNTVTDASVLERLIREQATWASVCTEPAMVALLAAKAASILGEPVETIEVCVSGGILKNALSAGLPNTPLKGPEIAAALGAISADPDKGLTILGGADDEQMEKALDMASSGKVAVIWDKDHEGVYGKCVARGSSHSAETVIEGSHTNFTQILHDGTPVHSCTGKHKSCSLMELRDWNLARLLEAVSSMDCSKMVWLLDGARSCMNLAEAFKDLTVDETISPAWVCSSTSCQTSVTDVAGRVWRAISARMGGTPWPVVTSGGSGNQGIMVSVPVMLLASQLSLKEDKTIRALLVAHSVNLFVKAYMGEVSCSCGGVGASAGIAAAICWMRDGTPAQIEEAISQVLASLFGMICDGAKSTCALKGTTSVVTGVLTGAGASEYQGYVRDQGVLGSTLEETLSRVAALNERVINRCDEFMLQMLRPSN